MCRYKESVPRSNMLHARYPTKDLERDIYGTGTPLFKVYPDSTRLVQIWSDFGMNLYRI